MNICILGDSLTSLSLAKNLVNKKLNVQIFYNKDKKVNNSPTRTIGISKSNIDYFNKEIIKINSNLLWDINKIEIFSEKLNRDKILNFEDYKNDLFSLIKNDHLYNLLNNDLNKNKLFKKKNLTQNILDKNFLKKYDLIINCDPLNEITKKFFSKSLDKTYNDLAFTTIIHHKKFTKNNSAAQIFTKYGPLAFLPLSDSKTSIVFSINQNEKKINSEKISDLIRNYNFRYNIKDLDKISKSKLKLSNLRNYYFKNILAFGDLLHRIHPLAGQGFNMTIRDIKILSKIIDEKLEIGLPIDASVAKEFENKIKHKNFIFSNSIDFIYEYFRIDNKFNNNNSLKMLKFFGNNNLLNKNLIKYANLGF